MMMLWYQLLYPAIAAGVLLRILLAGRSQALREGWPEIRQRCGCPAPEKLSGLDGGETIWIHAASVGEVIAAEPLVRLLAAAEGERRLLMTTSTVAGRERAAKISGVNAAVLLPMDFLPAVNAFLDRIRPRSLILMEKEFWPMLLHAALGRGVKVGVANGRITERSARRYGWIGGLLAASFARFTRVTAQTDADAERFRSLGIPAAAVAATGNMKYDLPMPSAEALAAAQEKLDELGWSESRIWVAGSTRRGEEEMVLDAFLKAVEKFPNLKLILAPRHTERSKEVATLLRAKGVRSVSWSQLLPFQADPACLLIDTMGVLGALYSTADAAFVGGTLVRVGGHNLLEPAMLAKPVLYGPFTAHTQAVAEALRAVGGGFVVHNTEELFTELQRLLQDEDHRRATAQKALITAESFTGATRRTYEHLRPVLEPDKNKET
ncbi:MAG: 3-deoxy-D-manno-octulosonic acid transferase [Elusimicrobiota bacterium]